MSTVRTRSEDTLRLVVESVALGLGYTTVLIWGGSALVAAFSSYEAYPYWPALSRLELLTSCLAPLLAALGVDLWSLLEQPLQSVQLRPHAA